MSSTPVYSVRKYSSQIRARTTTKNNQSSGFRTLASYIFGNNKSSTGTSDKIAMTSPVLIESRDDEMTMSFVLPSKYTRNDLPSPNNDQVVIHEVPEYTVAVITFTGSISEDIKCKKEKELRDACSGDGVKLASTSVYAGYCPPWTPWFWRTNEIHIPLVV